MSAKIALLSEQTINQIAAGEVIENPASVVKELVENAVDAGATQIVVETKGGGLQMLKVSDNGSGMNREDAILCLERHATSKIRSSDDLFSLHTMGFRGEALASIGSISKMTLTTALQDQAGTKVEVEGGIVKEIEVFPRNRGTTIEVRSLFYNVPARKRFQKSAAINSSEITRILTLLALSYPHIGFTLFHQDSQALKAPAVESDSFLEQMRKRGNQVLGEDFFADPFPISYAEGIMKIQGYLSSPLQTRNNRSGQYLFINKRAVICPLISYAIKDGYGMRLPMQRFPLYILHVELPAKMVDVNVHPQKKEVRLHEEKVLKDQIQRAINSALQETHEPAPKREFSFSAQQFSLLQEPAKRADLPLVFKEEPLSQISFSYAKPAKIIGIFSPYLLIDCASVKDRMALSKEEGILFVDLLAARSRIAFDSLMEKKDPDTQTLLLPVTLSLTPADAEVVQSHLPLFEEVGIGIRSIGPGSYIIDALPQFMDPEDAVDSLFSMIEELRSFFQETSELGKKTLALASASLIKKRKKPFSLEEGKALFEELLESKTPHECPHGKPTYTIVSSYDIERLFSKKN